MEDRDRKRSRLTGDNWPAVDGIIDLLGLIGRGVGFLFRAIVEVVHHW